MLKSLKKSLCVFAAILITVMSLTPAVFAAQTYPEGITKEQVSAVIPKFDTAISSLLKSTQNKTLKELILPEFYTDDVLSSLTTGIYTMIEENAESISSAGLDVTVEGVASCLGSYPKVQTKLSSYSKWSEVSLEGADWGIDGKKSFTKAAAAVLSPFNELLYMLLCGGTYSINSVIGIEGALGYETAIIPTLKAVGCEKITDSAVFYADAENNKNSMAEHLISDLFTFVESILDFPCDKLTDILPGIAYFLNGGGFDSAVSTLTEPLRLQIFNISTFIKVETILSFIQNSESYTQSFTLNFNDILGGTGLQMAEIDLQELASCGVVSGNTVISDKADTFLVLLRWFIDTMKLNKSGLSDMMGSEDSAKMTEIINSLMSKETDQLVKILISIFSAESGKILDYTWTFLEYTPTAVTYTPNLGADKYQRVVDGIDDLINEFIAEGGENETVREALGPQIYSNSLVTELVKGIYGAFESEEMKMLADIMGLSLRPAAVANELVGSAYSGARYTLSHNSKWSKISYINWGFKDGSKDGFLKAVCDALTPFEPILNMLLAEGKITVLGSVDIYGSNGYNTAIIPILEAIGCSAESIQTYEEFKASASEGKAVKSIATAVVSLIERILDKPVYTVTEMLPNLLYFMESGGLQTAIENLMYPFTELLSQLGMESMLDISQLTEEMDIDKIAADMIGSADIGTDLGNLDIKQIMSMGQSVSVQSKRTLNGQPATISYIKADQPAIIVTLLRFIADMMKSPDGENMMLGLMGSGGETAVFSNFSGGMGTELQAMTTDETVEWLYKIFFRERAVVEEKVKQKYLPTIIYTPSHNNTDGASLFAFALILVAGVIVAVKKKDKIASYLENRKIRKENKNESNPKEV